MEKTARRYDIDWLRTLGVLLVIPFHSLLIFNMQPWSIVYIKDTINVRLFNILDSVINRFHMPLLFVLAGMSVYFALKFRSKNQYINERVKKLLIPAIFGCTFLNPIMTYIYMVSKNRNGTFISHLTGFFSKNPTDFAGLGGGFTPAHFWFIIFLFTFSLVGLPLFIQLNKKEPSGFMPILRRFLEKPLMMIITVIPLAVLSEIDVLGDMNPLVYFAMFIIGFSLASYEKYQKALNRDKWAYFILSVLLITIKFSVPNGFEPWSAMWIIFGLVDKATRILPVFALIGMANSFMNKSNRVLEYLSQASFPIYMIHMLINTIVGFFIIKLGISAGLKFILIVIITFALCFLFYEIIRRIKGFRTLFAIKETKKNKAGIDYRGSKSAI